MRVSQLSPDSYLMNSLDCSLYLSRNWDEYSETTLSTFKSKQPSPEKRDDCVT